MVKRFMDIYLVAAYALIFIVIQVYVIQRYTETLPHSFLD